MTPFVVDANIIVLFQEERVSGNIGEAVAAIEDIVRHNCIALDPGRHCLQEWIEGAEGTFPFLLVDWVDQMIVSGRIKYFDLHGNTIRKHLLQIGLPQKDHKWVRLAIGCKGKKIVTEDIDFFDPKLKTAKNHQKAKAKQTQSGSCARALQRTYSIAVMCLCHVNDELKTLTTTN